MSGRDREASNTFPISSQIFVFRWAFSTDVEMTPERVNTPIPHAIEDSLGEYKRLAFWTRSTLACPSSSSHVDKDLLQSLRA